MTCKLEILDLSSRVKSNTFLASNWVLNKRANNFQPRRRVLWAECKLSKIPTQTLLKVAGNEQTKKRKKERGDDNSLARTRISRGKANTWGPQTNHMTPPPPGSRRVQPETQQRPCPVQYHIPLLRVFIVWKVWLLMLVGCNFLSLTLRINH